MNDYIKSLEEQNEDLKQMLAKEQLKVSELTHLYNLYSPVWEKSIIPVRQGCTDDREEHRYTYGGRLCVYADILWDRGQQGWKITWGNNLNLAPVVSCEYADIEDAKKQVEEQYQTSLKMANYL